VLNFLCQLSEYCEKYSEDIQKKHMEISENILKNSREGVPVIEIAQRFKVSPQTINRWCSELEIQKRPSLADKRVLLVSLDDMPKLEALGAKHLKNNDSENDELHSESSAIEVVIVEDDLRDLEQNANDQMFKTGMSVAHEHMDAFDAGYWAVLEERKRSLMQRVTRPNTRSVVQGIARKVMGG
jgi:hypothetical protein